MYLAYYLFLKFCSRRSESFSQATSFSANLPNFNPAMPKFNSFARNSQTSYSKTIRINSVPNRLFKVLVFDSMSRNGFIHLFGIIKWLDFIQKWDFHWIFNNFISITIATSVTFGRKWNKLIPQNICKKCHHKPTIFFFQKIFYTIFFKI